MAREVINVGAAPNDGQGDPIRTAYIKTNNNFAELYSAVQLAPPVTLIGGPGNKAGMIAYSPTAFYYCFWDYDGVNVIWGELPIAPGIELVNGTSNVYVTANGNVSVSVAGTSDVAVFYDSGFAVTGNLDVVGNVNVSGNLNYSNVTNLVVGDPLIYIGANNLSNLVDLGIVASYDPGVYQHGGIVRDHSDGIWKFFGNVVAEPTTVIDWGNAVYQPLQSGAFTATTGTFTGNVTTGNIQGTTHSGTTGTFTGNVSANNITGNITSSGTSSFSTATFSTLANITGSTAATSTTTGALKVAGGAGVVGNAYIGGLLTVTGNLSAGNLSGTKIAGTLSTAAQTNITSVGTLTSLAVTGNITSGNVQGTTHSGTTGTFSGNVITGNVSGTTGTFTNVGGTLSTAAQTNITSVGTLTSLAVTGNITTGNANASGNISASFFKGDGGYLTNVTAVGASATSIANGTSSIAFTGSGGNATITIGGTANVGVWATGGLYITGLGNATGNINGANLTTPGAVTATGNLNGNNATITNAVVAATGAFTGNVTTGNVSGTTHSGTTGTFTGNVTAGNLSVGTGKVTVGSIVNANANGVGNIGSSTLYFNTVFAQATSAQYADLAEMYQGDHYYSPGTVLRFGGPNEVTIAGKDHDAMVAGIVSTRPAYTMNSTLTGPTAVAIALAGRVPCNVQGPILRGQMLVTAGNGRARAEPNPAIGTVIGKALQDFDGSVGVIEIVVGRL